MREHAETTGSARAGAPPIARRADRADVPAAFVDVDETLVRCVSFLSLFLFDARRRGHGAEADTVVEEFRALRGAGMTRGESHRWFYRQWAGRDVADVRRIGHDWFTSCAADPAFFNTAVRRRLDELSRGGTHIVLVSGSFTPALRPIAYAVGATSVLCTTMETAAGKYTGKVLATMVGADKSAALLRYAERTAIDLATCTAFGDHHSDIAMFDLVGHPVVVGDADPRLRDYPAERLPG
ncbi:HAD family hydrolase [Nocardia abscessus]|uniref:HAD family hydrolase n=1 Tax=Nocardia abscessus TaxID=120957 RepID=UPI002455A6E3|nr:HAD-IB family hydrolase [Nocardia abscessus]